MTDIEFKGRVNLVWAAAAAASTEETRYYLNGVYVEPQESGGCLYVGTDGVVMICAFDKEGEANRPFILGGLPKKKIGGLKLPFGLDSADTLRFDGKILSSHLKDSKVAMRLAFAHVVDGTFPDFRKTIFARKDDATDGDQCFDPVLIYRLNLVSERLQGGKMVVDQGKLTPTPHHYSLSDNYQVLGTIMPIRGRKHPADMTEWRARFGIKPKRDLPPHEARIAGAIIAYRKRARAA